MAAQSLTMPWPERALPTISVAGRYPLPASPAELGRKTREYLIKVVALHQHDYSGIWTIRGHQFELIPGDITLTPPGERNWYELNRIGHHLCIHFDPLPIDGPALSLPLHIRPGPEILPVAERIHQIISLHRQSLDDEGRAKAARNAAGAALQALLLWLGWLSTREQVSRGPIPKSTEHALDRLSRVLDERYRESWTAASLAREANLSPNYLSRMFRRKFGMTLQRYLFQRRIECARHLLATSEQPIKAIAYECGLGSPQYFSRKFRLEAGMAPSAARK
jgi:AraC family transcriptional regulator